MKWADLDSHFTLPLGGDRPHSSRNVKAWRRIPAPAKNLTAARPSEQYGLLPIPVFTASRSPLLLGIPPVGWGSGTFMDQWTLSREVPPNRYGLSG
jgi:hypothetical protein